MLLFSSIVGGDVNVFVVVGGGSGVQSIAQVDGSMLRAGTAIPFSVGRLC